MEHAPDRGLLSVARTITVARRFSSYLAWLGRTGLGITVVFDAFAP
ncbi:hypothetical protein TRICHSKD4_5607 [Roseibium sp. TrichSKD4]|nr:hypothetical protein TRICHSKD4_5607 [Roseibium sp. TrichSKD4]